MPQAVWAAEALESELEASGIEVLYDDRSESPGVKFNDADLIGLPVRVVVSPRNLKDGVVEIRARDAEQAVKAPQAESVGQIKSLLAERGI